MPCTDKSRNTKKRENKNECVLAFFSVVASYSNFLACALKFTPTLYNWRVSDKKGCA